MDACVSVNIARECSVNARKAASRNSCQVRMFTGKATAPIVMPTAVLANAHGVHPSLAEEASGGRKRTPAILTAESTQHIIMLPLVSGMQ